MSENTGQAQSAKMIPRYADVTLVRDKFAGTIQEIIEAIGEVTLIARREGLIDLMTFMRDEPSLRFDYLSDIGGLDLGEFASPRFAVSYQLYSLEHNHRLRIKVFVEEDDAVLPSLWSIWKASNWLEREIYDMFGVSFDNHPDLRRILMPADYEGIRFVRTSR
ncbi:MAG: NADH-quinone oxidoreductase subunit C [Acidobacteria bacterium]|nr:NADH-quinone oxidoreductase subunit C [Acidobacteriota bacterium]